MSKDTLDTLLRIRRTSLDDAQHELAKALQHQQHKQTISEGEETRYASETVAALNLAAGDEAVEAFARWMPIGRKGIETARALEQEAAGIVDRTRVVLGLARAAYRSVELLIEKRAEQEKTAQDRKEQRELDELSGRGKLPARSQ